LNDLSNRLAEVGPETDNPAAFLPNLAGSLNNQANRRSEVGDRAGALAAIDEAVTLFRRLADPETGNPAAFLPNLAGSLSVRTTLLIDSGESFTSAAAAWSRAVGDQSDPSYRGQLLALFAACAKDHDGSAVAELIAQAVADVTDASPSVAGYALARARQTVRGIARDLEQPPPGLPDWAVADLPDTDIDLFNAWLADHTADTIRSTLDGYPGTFPGTLPTSLTIVSMIDPTIPTETVLRLLLDAITSQGLEPVLTELRTQEATARAIHY